MMGTIGKALHALACIALLSGLVVLAKGHWVQTIACFVVAGISAVAGYKLSGGAENPEIYADLDLFGLVAYAVTSANARIGFHGMRSQEELVNRLREKGLAITDASGLRDQIRSMILKDRDAYDACRDLIVIQTVHGGREHFWDGHGNPKPVAWFNQAEIIVDVRSTSEKLIQRLFQVTRREPS